MENLWKYEKNFEICPLLFLTDKEEITIFKDSKQFDFIS